ncbi:hypothetical protein JCM9743_33530 [Natrinema sp. JCM 9743]
MAARLSLSAVSYAASNIPVSTVSFVSAAVACSSVPTDAFVDAVPEWSAWRAWLPVNEPTAAALASGAAVNPTTTAARRATDRVVVIGSIVGRYIVKRRTFVRTVYSDRYVAER